MIDRNSWFDAEQCITSLMASSHQKPILSFLGEIIEVAAKINNENWNLNLDLKGRFLRFNVGQEYCFQISNSECLILCIRSMLPEEAKNNESIEYLGYHKDKEIRSHELSALPDCLVKVPNSIGCIVKDNFDYCLGLLKNPCLEFVSYAIGNTKILPQMISAHSVGAIMFLSKFLDKQLPNPLFAVEAVKRNELTYIKKVKRISYSRLREIASKTQGAPQKIEVKNNYFVRNPYVAELAKRLANGICQDCRKPAPFINKFTGEPYLEVHHEIPLSEGGEDTIDNVIALCPNCHRKRHYG